MFISSSECVLKDGWTRVFLASHGRSVTTIVVQDTTHSKLLITCVFVSMKKAQILA